MCEERTFVLVASAVALGEGGRGGSGTPPATSPPKNIQSTIAQTIVLGYTPFPLAENLELSIPNHQYKVYLSKTNLKSCRLSIGGRVFNSMYLAAFCLLLHWAQKY